MTVRAGGGDKLGLCDGLWGLNGGCMRASGSKSGLCDSQIPCVRAIREFTRAVKGYIAKMGVVDLFMGHLMKVKGKNLKMFFIGKILRFRCIYLALFNLTTYKAARYIYILENTRGLGKQYLDLYTFIRLKL